MTYHHVFWTRPQLDPKVEPDRQELPLWDFELLIWCLSALQARRLGTLSLITDSRGAVAAERAGLAGFYDGGISTRLDRVPQQVNPSVFWAGGKLYAYREAQAPCVFVDLDAVLWKAITPSSGIMALHAEDRKWAWYAPNEQDFKALGFAGKDWNWELDPFNTGVLFFGHQDAARHYGETACRFAEAYSESLESGRSSNSKSNEVMLFAEQRLLPMCAARFGVRVQPISHAKPSPGCFPANDQCLHLWRAKLAYKFCPDARLAMVNWCIERLLTDFPESVPVLKKWGLDQRQTLQRHEPPNPKEYAGVHHADLRFSLLKNVTGTINIKDLATGITRRAAHGCMVWSGEIIEPERGAGFELEVLGSDTLAFRAMP